jgi:hypothetical protein
MRKKGWWKEDKYDFIRDEMEISMSKMSKSRESGIVREKS